MSLQSPETGGGIGRGGGGGVLGLQWNELRYDMTRNLANELFTDTLLDNSTAGYGSQWEKNNAILAEDIFVNCRFIYCRIRKRTGEDNSELGRELLNIIYIYFVFIYLIFC